MELSSHPSAPRTCSPSGSPDYPHREVTDRIIGAAIEVHRRLGPGFLENAYEEAMCLELQERHIPFQQQVSVNVRYRGVIVDRHRMDLVVESKVVVELKAVRQVEDLHLAVALAYLRAAGLTTGLILNFSEAKLRVRRVVKSLRATAEAPRCDSAEDMVGAANGAPGAASVSRPE